MAFFTLQSTNPNFSFVLRKNPAAGLVGKRFRQGSAWGFYPQPDEYAVFFRDAAAEISYKTNPDEEFEYNDLTRYTSPLFVLNGVAEFLGSAYKKADEQDTPGFEHTFYHPMVHVKRLGHLKLFPRYFEGEYNIEIIEDEATPGTVGIRIKTNKTIRELLNMVNLIYVFIAIKNEDIQDISVEKYLGCLSVVDAPYFVRYIFKVNFLNRRADFEKHKATLETTNRPEKMEFSQWGTQKGRIEFVKKQLTGRHSIIDIGCGEGQYIREFIRTAPEYVAIDKDETIIADLTRKADLKKWENISFFDTLDTYEQLGAKVEKPDVLLVEVLEHMPLEDAQGLLSKAVTMDFNKMVVTTPNVEFNQFYVMDEDESRHHEHHFEFTKKQFQNFINNLTGKKRFNLEYSEIGDRVNGIAPTHAVVITRKTEPEVTHV